MPGGRDARVVGVGDVTGCAARRAVIAGMIVCPEEIERRVEQTRFLQREIDRVGAVGGGETAGTHPLVRFPVVLVLIGVADLEPAFAAAFKNTQYIAGLRYL